MAVLLLLGAEGGNAAAQGAVWSLPVNVSKTPENSVDPTLAVDAGGGVHLVWVENLGENVQQLTYAVLGEQGWSEPNDIIAGTALEPRMVGDRLGNLHLVYRGAGAIMYSQAYAPAAFNARGWSKPVFASPVHGSATVPDLAVDNANRLHLVYSVLEGDERGIYYAVSEDLGKRWSNPERVTSDRSSSGSYFLRPRLAVSAGGSMHVVWIEATVANPFPPRGVYYRRTADRGRTWSDTEVLGEGPYDNPGIVTRAPNEVHVVWSGTTPDRYKFHRWSADDGASWRSTFRNTQLGGYQGWPALVVDNAGMLHWIQVGTAFGVPADPDPAIGAWRQDSLTYANWSGQGWSPIEVVLSGSGVRNGAVQATAGIARGNELHTAMSYPIVSSGATGYQFEIYHASRTLTSARSVAGQPLATATPASGRTAPVPTRTAEAPTGGAPARPFPAEPAPAGPAYEPPSPERTMLAGIVPVIILALLLVAGRLVRRA